MQVAKEKQSQAEMIKAKQELQKDFARKKALVLKKMQSLKDQNKSIEEIYKYTNEIIFEEDSD